MITNPVCCSQPCHNRISGKSTTRSHGGSHGPFFFREERYIGRRCLFRTLEAKLGVERGDRSDVLSIEGCTHIVTVNAQNLTLSDPSIGYRRRDRDPGTRSIN